MISAVSKYGAASSAKRIISTAQIEKLEAMTQLAAALNSSAKRARSSSVSPVVPTTAWMPCIASHGTVRRAASATVKSTTTSAPASASARGSPATVTPSTVRADSAGIDRGDQLQIGIERDGPAHRGAHPPAGPGHTYSHPTTVRAGPRRSAVDGPVRHGGRSSAFAGRISIRGGPDGDGRPGTRRRRRGR